MAIFKKNFSSRRRGECVDSAGGAFCTKLKEPKSLHPELEDSSDMWDRDNRQSKRASSI